MFLKKSKVLVVLFGLILSTFLENNLMAQSLAEIRVMERGSVLGGILNFSQERYGCQAFVNGVGTLEWVTIKIPKAKLKVDLHGNMRLIEKETPVSIAYHSDGTIFRIGKLDFHYNSSGKIQETTGSAPCVSVIIVSSSGSRKRLRIHKKRIK